MVNRNESLDVNAKTVEEAIEQGLQALNLSRDQVEIKVINEGKRGIFGIGSEEAVVRLTPKQQAAEPLSEISTPSNEIDFTTLEEPATPASHEEKIDESEPEEDIEVSSAASTLEVTEAASPADFTPDSDVAELAKRCLAELLEHMGIEAEVTPRIAADLVDPGEEPPLVLDVTGNDLGILIGRHSETLQALQYMVRLMVSKELQSWQRIVVDVESYRARRRRSLYQMAKRMAERAVSSGERVVMESMPAYDRRIIHVALRDHPDVFTKSIGRESNRKVTIIPK
ncbi:MAG: Jag N-terminal domain-containing protein [Anaerolineaceae bacterium]|nr:Jag N-terminal domain-containing protein [Anaerolineaceae bacterium]